MLKCLPSLPVLPLQLSHVLNALKFTLAVPGAQILSEGMTQAEVHAAMEKLRQQNAAGGQPARQSASGQATPLMQAAARRLSQEAALSSGGEAGVAAGPPAAGAQRLSAEAVATAALLQEASQMSRLHAEQQQPQSEAEEVPEPLDVQAALSLAEACAQVSCHIWPYGTIIL